MRPGLAVGRSILIIAWHLLSDDTAQFHDLGPDYYDSHVNLNRKVRNHARELQSSRLQGHPRTRRLNPLPQPRLPTHPRTR